MQYNYHNSESLLRCCDVMFKYVNTSKSPGHGQIKNAIIWSEHLVNSEKTILFHRWQARGRIFRDCNLRSRWTNIFTFGTHRSTSTPSPFWGLAPCLRMDNFIPEVREREGNGKNPFPKFRNGKGMKKKAFPKFGNGKGMKKYIPKIREREENEKNPFPQFGNRNQRLSFPGVSENGNRNRQKR